MDLLGRTVQRHASAVQDDHTLTASQSKTDVVRRHKNRTAVGDEPGEDPGETLYRVDIQPGERLVRQQHSRAMDQSPRDGQALQQATRKNARPVVSTGCQSRLCEQSVGTPGPVAQIVQSRRKDKVLHDGQLGVNHAGVGNHAQLSFGGFRFIPQIKAPNLYGTSVRAQQPGQNAKQRALSSAVDPAQTDGLPARYEKIDAFENRSRAKRLGDGTDRQGHIRRCLFYCRLGHAPPACGGQSEFAAAGLERSRHSTTTVTSTNAITSTAQLLLFEARSASPVTRNVTSLPPFRSARR